jgi:hypothetical protein
MSCAVAAWHRGCFLPELSGDEHLEKTIAFKIKGFLVFSLATAFAIVCPHTRALADDSTWTDPVVNQQIHETYMRVDIERRRAELEYKSRPEILRPLQARPEPMKDDDPLLENIPAPGLGEQEGAQETPQIGISHYATDVSEAIQRKLVEEQAYELFRDHYRRAVNEEFHRRVRAAGLNTTRNIAEEIKAREDRLNR